MSNTAPKGNPAVVGLAGFGITTMLLQFHNVGWCGVGPVVSMAFIFGGLAQLIAGYQEFKCANNFGFSAFVSYGSFWIALGIIFLLNHFKVYHSSTEDVGWFLVAWTLYTFIMWIPAMKIHSAMAITFTLFLMDLKGKMLAHPFQPELTKLEHVLLITDPTDKALFVHFVNLARTAGQGWVEYMWPKPGKTTPSKKLSYIYRVPGHDVFVGAGVYVGGMLY
jgi:hypothetical protein